MNDFDQPNMLKWVKRKNQTTKNENKKKKTNFIDLINNFEFEIIFSFLPLKEIVQLSRISKIFHYYLRTDEFWDNLSRIHYNKSFKNENYKNTIELMQYTSLYFLKSFDCEIPRNISFFNDKNIKKIVHNRTRFLVLTDKSLYNVTVEYGEMSEPQILFSTFGKILDVSLNNYQRNVYDIGDRGIILNQYGKPFIVESFIKSKCVPIEFKEKFPNFIHVESPYDGIYIILSESGELYRSFHFKDMKLILKNIKSISKVGAIDVNQQFISMKFIKHLGSKDYNKKKKENVIEAKGIHFGDSTPWVVFRKVQQVITSKNENHTNNLKKKFEEIDDFFVGEDIVVFKTKLKHFFFHEKESLVFSKFQNTEIMMNKFPFEISNIVLSKNFAILQSNVPYSDLVQEKLKLVFES
jgi:hypothetical protein